MVRTITPVTGVSWYEAAAYAAFAHKQLPTVFHWAVMADTSRSEFLLPLSNFSRKSTSAIGSLPGLSTFGVYDLAGNAREWTLSQSGDSDQRFILGGGWTDPSYAFNDSFTQPALDRSESNGSDASRSSLRIHPRPHSGSALDGLQGLFQGKAVNDATFASFSRQFIYDKAPLGATIEKTPGKRRVEGGCRLDRCRLQQRAIGPLCLLYPRTMRLRCSPSFSFPVPMEFMRAHSSRIHQQSPGLHHQEWSGVDLSDLQGHVMSGRTI